MPNYRRTYVAGHPVFLTVVTYQRRAWLAQRSNAVAVVEGLRKVKKVHPFRHAGYSLLPDHLHLLIEPADSNFSTIVAALKRNVTARFRRDPDRPRPPYWQPRFYDHIVRDDRDFWRHLDYIHFNPVKHGVAKSPGQHEFSSFNAWCARGAYENDWGQQEPSDLVDLDLE